MAVVALGTAATLSAAAAIARRQTYFLGKDEQLVVEKFTGTVVHNGPGLKSLMPCTYRSAKIKKAESLGMMDYVKVKDTVDGSERIEKGPKLLFLGAYDTVDRHGKGVTLSSSEYVLIEDKMTGKKTVTQGPCVWFPGPQEEGVKGSAIALSSTDYVAILDKHSGERRVVKGPRMWFPGPMEEGKKGTGISLNSTEYVLVANSSTGERRVEVGPRIWFPAPLEEGKKGNGHSLSGTQYLIVEDRRTGETSMVQGPRIWFPGPFDSPSQTFEAVALQDDEYLRLKDMATGQRWVERGKALVFLKPTWRIELDGLKGGDGRGVRKAWVLKKYEFVRLLNGITGQVVTHRGEATIFPKPDEQALDKEGKMAAIDLKVNEYVKVLDQASGDIRVVRGPEQVFLGPHERPLDGGKQKAVEVDIDHAVLVRNKESGQLRLVTENQLFIPGPTESIEKVQNLIRLAEHEAMIIKDKEGRFQYRFGSAEKHGQGSEHPPSFFLPPYAEVVRLCWSRGRRREKRDLFIERFDCRAQYMSFEFNCRTKDNVELVLEGTFFWEVVDLPVMVRTTGDTSGDICNHARSQFIKQVARVTLKEFMDDLNIISNKVYQEDQTFYESRGVKVHSLEVTGYQCAEQSTSQVLQQIIQETTNRMNRLSQQESENEVKLFKMQGQIEQERLNGELLTIQQEHSQAESKVSGAAEADRVAAFIKGLATEVPRLEDRVSMWQTLRKTDALSVVSQGGASLYYTPNDVNLSIESRPPAAS